MNLIDANVLLYAVNERSRQQGAARSWIDAALSGAEAVGFSWVVLLAFLRLATRSGLFPRPLTTAEATDVVDRWLGQPAAAVLHPGSRHLQILRDLLEPPGSGGNLVTDAHLAALAIEHDAGIVSFDRDFERFPGVRVEVPSGAT